MAALGSGVVVVDSLIRVEDVVKIYHMGAHEVQALRGVSLTVERGDFVAIMGRSGSGKSTLMNVLGCLDQPTSGTYELNGVEVSTLTDDELALIRNQQIGFVFQRYNLLPRLPAVEQVELPLLYRRMLKRREKAVAALEAVGLGHRMDHAPSELSGGEQQRVSIARAMATSPSLILADEPTGALDARVSGEIMEIFTRLNAEQGLTVILVTHERDIAAYARRVIEMRDGQIISDEPVGAV